MKAILFVMATGIVASAIVELVDGWRRYQSRRARRAAVRQSMIPKRPAPDLIRGVQRFSQKIMLER